LAALALPALLAGCRPDVVVVPAYDTYYPVVVGTYRTYAVADSTWARGVLTTSSYQFRERVSEQFTDAAGQPAYRVVRSRRPNSAATWVDDSVLVVQPQPRFVLLTRDNVRTVELVYPVRADKGWNANAFGAAADTISSLTRFYGSAVGVPYTTPAAGGQPAKPYAATVQTYATLPAVPPATQGAPDVNLYYQRGLQQVYAQGVGLVQRRRFSHYTYITDLSTGLQTLTPGQVQNGFSRFEVLTETGNL